MSVIRAKVTNESHTAQEAGALRFPPKDRKSGETTTLEVEASSTMFAQIDAREALSVEVLGTSGASTVDGPQDEERARIDRELVKEAQDAVREDNDSLSGAEVSDNARLRATQLGVDLTNVEGTGPGGQILLQDVRRYVASNHPYEPSVPPDGTFQATTDVRAGALPPDGFHAQVRPGDGDDPAQGGTGKPAEEGSSMEGVKVNDQGRDVTRPYGGFVTPIAAEDDDQPEATPDPDYVKGVVENAEDPEETKVTEKASGGFAREPVGTGRTGEQPRDDHSVGGSDGAGNAAPIEEPDAQGERQADGDVDATEKARERADEYGIDLAGVEGTGSEGRITVEDVERAKKERDGE